MRTLRILLVEDDALLAAVFSDVLADMGHIVCAIEATEAAAVDAAERLKPDLMIVDAYLGDGNGIAAVEQILRAGYVPHLFISGDVASIRSRTLTAIAIQKPFRAAELALGIERALGAPAAA